MALQHRIKEVMGDTSAADFAREMGVTDATVHFWLMGKTRAIKGENAATIEKKRGFRAKWVIDGTLPKRVNEKTVPEEQTPEYAGTRTLNVRKVVVVGTARLSEGDEGFYDEISSTPGAGDGHMEIATGDPDAYGLRVRGNSMAPAIRDGWYVLVEPNSAPAVGEYVLVKLRNGQKMVKELLYRRSESIEVLSVNNGARRTIYAEEIESIQAVAAVVPPSKWKPD